MLEDDGFYETCVKNFVKVTELPTNFLENNEKFCDDIKSNLKTLYDFTKSNEIKNNASSALAQLVVKDFDLEQIWQQLELQNDFLITESLLKISKCVVNKTNLLFEKKQEIGSDLENDSDASDKEPNLTNENSDENNDNLPDENETDEEEEEEKEEKPKGKSSIVDDAFFKLSEMEKFLQAEEAREDPDSGNDSDESEESADLFDEQEEEEEDAGLTAKYKDFFVKQDQKKDKSTFEVRQSNLERKIEEIEEEAVKDKSWQLKGEVSAESRPQNSLLEEIVDFDLTTRPAPVITEQTTFQLEDIIRQRIKDRAFDSVERKAKPVETALEYKKKLVLEQEKSKESLAQIYEREFLEQQAALDKDEEREEKEPQLHTEVNQLMKDLFFKLDALSNFHFTPRPAVPELKIVSNVGAISMEEVAPVAVSDAQLLAPEEVKPKLKGDEIGRKERTKTDKKRERRKKKLKQKLHAKEKTSQSVNKKEKKVKGQANNDVKVKSSKAFFQQLQEEVETQVKKRKSDVDNKTETKSMSAKKFKL